MSADNNQEVFSYRYSAKEQEELRRIRQKYMPEEADKMTRLKRLDASVTRKGEAVSLIVGIVGTLVLGVGMCCCMVWGGALFVPGILIGLVGIAGVTAAYPLYSRITKRERQRIAPEILRLTEELMK